MPHPTPPGDTPVVVPPPDRRRKPYAVEQAPSHPSMVHLVGYDSQGEWMVGVELRPTLYSTTYVEELLQWMKAHDETQPPETESPLI